MNWKKLWLTALIVLIALEITNIIIHGHLLMSLYSAPDASPAFRPTDLANHFMWVFFVTGAVFSFFFSFFFAKGYENRGLAEGLRFGLYVGVFYYFTTSFNEFVIYPIPYRIVWYWIICGVIQTIILGIIAALIYKPKTAL
jgi:hypothetical protein